MTGRLLDYPGPIEINKEKETTVSCCSQDSKLHKTNGELLNKNVLGVAIVLLLTV